MIYGRKQINSKNIEKVLFVGFQTKIDIQMQQILNES